MQTATKMKFIFRTLFIFHLVDVLFAVIISRSRPAPPGELTAGEFQTSDGFTGLDWYYQRPQGPETWPILYPGCAGRRQSPIALREHQAIVSPEVGPLELFGYHNRHMTLKAFNNGHVVKFQVFANTPIQKPARLTSGPLKQADSYELAEIHLHWGKSDLEGSEHSLEGQLYPAEVHFVHKLSGLTIEQAMVTPKGLAVLGTFFTIGQVDNPDYMPIISALQNIQFKNTSSTLHFDKTLRRLLPNDVTQFFRYDGSLTTPTCNEVVVWTVFKNPVWISKRQMQAFRNVMKSYQGDPSPVPMLDNYRPVQHTNGRPVYKHGMRHRYY